MGRWIATIAARQCEGARVNIIKLLVVVGIGLYIGIKAGIVGGVIFAWLAFVVLF